MSATTTISTIRSTLGCEFISHKMFGAGTTMSTTAEDADIINEIVFLGHYSVKTLVERQRYGNVDGIRISALHSRFYKQGDCFQLLVNDHQEDFAMAHKSSSKRAFLTAIAGKALCLLFSIGSFHHLLL